MSKIPDIRHDTQNISLRAVTDRIMAGINSSARTRTSVQARWLDYMTRVAIILNCSILAGCIASAPHMSTPIATWQGKNPVDTAVSCVIKALDYNFGSPRPPLPGITHRAKVVEEGRVYEIAPETAFGIEPLYFVRVRPEGPQKTIIELFILPIKYETPLRDALAKCA
jgi:hypothetical protein